MTDKTGISSIKKRKYHYLPIAVRRSRVLKNRVPSEIAGEAMQVSPSLFVATTENFPSAGTTNTFPTSLAKKR